MTKKEKFILWAPRILSILLLIFLSLFSLDMIEPGKSAWEIFGGIFMHNIPVFILLIILIISWKRPVVGGVVFTLAGLLYIFSVIMGQNDWLLEISRSLIIAGPALLTGILFLISSKQKTKI